MYLFKTSGETFDSVIRNQKHAFHDQPQHWKEGEVVLISKNVKDLTSNEKQIRFIMRLIGIRPVIAEEIDKYWPGTRPGQWMYIADCRGIEPVPSPFNLKEVLGDSARRYTNAKPYYKIHEEHEQLLMARLPSTSVTAPNEFVSQKQYEEGACYTIELDAYERDPKAREACIKHYGISCQICDFNFEAKYGQVGANFIHVHHVVSLAQIGQQHKVDPKKDLLPVCPNCHAMLHRKKIAMSVDDLKEQLTKSYR
jgi:hypothetical protein